MTRLCDDPTRSTMLAYLTLMIDECPHGARGENQAFDIEEAVYWFSHDWHGGQGSNLYAALSQSPFAPSPIASYIQADSIAGMLYDLLELQYTTPALPRGWDVVEV